MQKWPLLTHTIISLYGTVLWWSRAVLQSKNNAFTLYYGSSCLTKNHSIPPILREHYCGLKNPSWNFALIVTIKTLIDISKNCKQIILNTKVSFFLSDSLYVCTLKHQHRAINFESVHHHELKFMRDALTKVWLGSVTNFIAYTTSFS